MPSDHIAPILQVRKLGHRRVEGLAQGPTVRKWLSQDLNPVCPLEPRCFFITLCGFLKVATYSHLVTNQQSS